MAKKLEIKGFKCMITDTETGVEEFRCPSKDVRDTNFEGNDIITLYENEVAKKKYNWNDLVDSTGTGFGSKAAVLKFFEDNTGFNTPGATGEDLNKYVAITTQNTTIELAVATETYCTTSAAAFTFTLQTPISGRVNESVVIFKTSTTPIITHPIDTIWLGATPTFSASETWVVVYEQVYNGTAYFIYGTAIKKV